MAPWKRDALGMTPSMLYKTSIRVLLHSTACSTRSHECLGVYTLCLSVYEAIFCCLHRFLHCVSAPVV